jgi:effector-binding domain-containing protein
VIDTPQVVQAEAQPAAVIHLTVSRSEIQNVMGPAIGEITAALAAQGVAPAGPMFAHHLRMDPQNFDLEVGFPVAAPVAASGRVKPSELPAARVARTVYHGPFEGLHCAWAEFDAWFKDQGLTRGATLWERYVAGPESGSDPSTWRTELNRPLAS